MKILGIDPGLRITGFGVIQLSNRQLQYITSGVIRTPTAAAKTSERLKVIFEGISQLIKQYQPQQTAVEQVFVNINPQSTLLLGQARGAALCALVCAELPVFEYTALQLKQAVVGYGKASKAQVQAMVVRLLNLQGMPSVDAADALGVAICHAHRYTP